MDDGLESGHVEQIVLTPLDLSGSPDSIEDAENLRVPVDVDPADAAVNRRTLDGKNPKGWFPEQKITVAEAVEAYTMGSAYAEFQEKEKGSITPGKLADMVLLTDDIFSIAPERIRDVRVLKTIVGGRLVFDAVLQGHH